MVLAEESPLAAPAGAAAYLERTVRTWLGVGEDTAVPALPRRLADLLLRTEEREIAHRDQWGEWEHPFSQNYRDGKLWVPEIDEWLAERHAELARRGNPGVPLWPEGRRFAVCLTHDVDHYSHEYTWRQRLRQVATRTRSEDADLGPGALRFLPYFLRQGACPLPDAAGTLEAVLDLEREVGAVSSFFFTVYPQLRSSRYDGVAAPDDPVRFRGRALQVRGLMRALAAEGFDVGLHGCYFSASDAAVLADQKRRLDEALGEPAVTSRQHWLNWRVDLTPGLQAGVGLLADSTLGFNRNVGFRAGTGLPFHVFDPVAGRELPLLQMPLVIQDGALFSASGLECDLALARTVVGQIVDRVAACGGGVTLLFHPEGFTAPRVRDLYRWTLAYCRDAGGWLTSLRGVLGWWAERSRRIAGS